MIEGENYMKIVDDYFDFLKTEFGFSKSEEKIRGSSFYDAHYVNEERIISISYENLEDYLQIIVFMLIDGQLPDYDDKSKTLHLNHLNSLLMAKIEKDAIINNNQYFSKYNVKTELERKLLKGARELRICLMNFDKIGM